MLGLINRFHLYQTYAFSPDDQVEKMRDDVKMDLISGESNISGKAELLAFRISYKAPNAGVAQKVTIALTSFFVDENVRASQEQSEATTLFLDGQARVLGEQLAEQETKLRAYQSGARWQRCRNKWTATSRSSTVFSNSCRPLRRSASGRFSSRPI